MVKSGKVVRITESKLVDLIDGIVNEAVETQKKAWLSEQKSKNEIMLENKINRLEKLIKENLSKK